MQERLETEVPISTPGHENWAVLATFRPEKAEYSRNIGLMDTPFTPDQIGRLWRLAGPARPRR